MFLSPSSSISSNSNLCDVESDHDSDTETPGLPSLPLSLRKQLLKSANEEEMLQRTASVAGSSTTTMTMKEFDGKLDLLRRENFNLKLRLYFAEKDKNGPSANLGLFVFWSIRKSKVLTFIFSLSFPFVVLETESMLAKELIKQEKSLQSYKKIISGKDDEISKLKRNYERAIFEHQTRIEGLLLHNLELNYVLT